MNVRKCKEGDVKSPEKWTFSSESDFEFDGGRGSYSSLMMMVRP